MNIMQIITFRLHPDVANTLNHAAFTEATTWLKQWTPRANIKAVVSGSRKESLSVLRKDLSTSLVPWFLDIKGVKPEHFQFEVSEQEVDDGRFWMPSSLVWCHWHDVVEARHDTK